MGSHKAKIAEDLAWLIKSGNPFQVPFNTGWSATVTGSGTTGQALTYLQVATGVTASSTARLSVLLRSMGIGVTTWNEINWAKKLYVYMVLNRRLSDTEAIARFQVKTVSTEGQLAAVGIGLQFDNLAVTGESYGTERGTVALSTTLTTSVPVRILIVLTPGVSIEFYVNDVLKGTISTAAAIPTGTSGVSMVSSIINGVTGGVNAELTLSNLWLWQQP